MKAKNTENKLIAGTMFAFMVSGATSLALGSLIPFLRSTYNLSYEIAGMLVSLQSVGNLVSVGLMGFLPVFLGRRKSVLVILRNAPPIDNIHLPDVWDPCHSQQLLWQMVSIINNRNADCPVTEKAIRKNKATVVRVFMDRPTAENKIDHSVPSRQVYDQVIALIDPKALSEIEDYYKERHWEWLRRYFLSRSLFNQEEQQIRAEIDQFQTQIQAFSAQTAAVSQSRNQLSILSNASSPSAISTLNLTPSAGHVNQLKALEYQNKILYEKQEEFNARFNSFTREVGEFALTPFDSIAKQYGTQIAEIWDGFEIDEPYSMCMAFLSLLDQGSDLPWCYFPNVILQSL